MLKGKEMPQDKGYKKKQHHSKEKQQHTA